MGRSANNGVRTHPQVDGRSGRRERGPNTNLALDQVQTPAALGNGFPPGRPVAYGLAKRAQYSKKAHGVDVSSGSGWTVEVQEWGRHIMAAMEKRDPDQLEKRRAANSCWYTAGEEEEEESQGASGDGPRWAGWEEVTQAWEAAGQVAESMRMA